VEGTQVYGWHKCGCGSVRIGTVDNDDDDDDCGDDFYISDFSLNLFHLYINT
jgi:hypothetical protein